jgi:hypothetical protein
MLVAPFIWGRITYRQSRLFRCNPRCGTGTWLDDPMTETTRFALWSRKPMERVRRRYAAESVSNESRNRPPIQPDMAQASPAVSTGGSSPSFSPPELGKKLREESCHGIPRNTLTVELSSSNCVPTFKTRPNIGTMLQHCKDPLHFRIQINHISE